MLPGSDAQHQPLCLPPSSPSPFLGEPLSSRPALSTMGTTEATLRMENVDVKEEWQDEDFPRFVSCKKMQREFYFFL